jgi:polyisoprenoid-binding protein YceI
MAIPPGHHELGPNDATLTVHTGKAGAASKAGHNLRIEVTSWHATLDVGDAPERTEMALTADPRSLRVREGTGGAMALGDDDKASIEQTIDDEVLEGAGIAFRSRRVEEGPDGMLTVEGDLDLAGNSHPVEFELVAAADGRLSGSARIKQTDWGIKPYSALFGTLKVVDEVGVEIEGTLPA